MASMSRPGGSSDTSRKRRRNNNNNNEGNNYHHQQSILPEIPGVPIDVVPYLVEALKLATKVFQKSNATSHSRMKPGNSSSFTTTKDRRRQILTGNGGDNDNDDRKQQHPHQQQQNSLHASLMNRVETATQQPSDAAREEEERVNRMNDAVEKWLGTLKRFARGKPALSEQQQQQQDDENNNNNNNKAKMMSVPYACFVYLWQLQQDHPRVPVRRAALFLSGPLLQKSRDCRFHLEQDSNLSTWLSNIVVGGGVEGGGGGGGAAITWKNPEQAKRQLPLLQKEAYWVLSYLVDEGYADELYPKIGVAKQRLAQQCPDLNLEDSADVTEMTIRRQRRDIALKYGEKEIKRVRKIVQHCENCLEILVPRIGVENNNNNNNETSKAAAVNTAVSTTTTAAATVEPAVGGEINEDDDDDDDDIDWDDGDDFGEEEEDNQAATTTPKEEEESNHLAAVERTLAAMQSAGGLLRDGGIEIDLAKTDADEGTSTTGGGGTAINMEVLSKLEKHVKVLAGRHLPRLTRWLDGLINADNLVLRMGDNSSSSSSSMLSLISLPSSTAKRRRELVDQLSVLKQEASSILSSATRLDIQHDNNEESAAAPPPRPALRPDLNSSRNTSGGRRTPLVSPSLSSRAKKQQQRARQQQQQLRSNRVEIKLRK